ncbi:hypothetical protein ACFQY4_17745 [Catellatospora bangladeshensis]|uniref:Lipoprotein n=1 Tax=Catellatospora bangladeshensis TaxID=310355 RepID=A0A8J3NI68_9ACTN|nr:hypothetical protein [Catellatospora bangladeshensis]GIF82135.1 hypothetical protein Cba03nite_34840 [Catellatospora bangladeshensis]
MRRTAFFMLLAVVVAGAAACGDQAQPQAVASADAPAPTAPAGSAAADAVASIAFACEAADGLYATLNKQTQAHIQRGFEAEQRGDTAAVAKELQALEPMFRTVSAKFGEAADRVADPEVKVALSDLAEAASTASSFTKFSDFGAMQQLTVSAELVLIRKCRYSGYKMVNLV